MTGVTGVRELTGAAAEKAVGRRRHPHRHFARLHTGGTVTILHSERCLTAFGAKQLSRCAYSQALSRWDVDIPQGVTVAVILLSNQMVVDLGDRPESNALPDVEAWLED